MTDTFRREMDSNPCEALLDPADPGGPVTVMVVDDTPANLHLLAHLIERKGYHTALFPRADMALEYALREPPDIILLDIMMPGMDGIAFAHRLREDPVLVEVPVIFVSALDDVDSKLRAFEAGGVDYLTKPFQENEVIARLDTHLKLRRSQRALQTYQRKLECLVQARTEELLRAQRVGRIGSWVLDFRTNTIEWSPEVFRLFGVDQDAPIDLDYVLARVYPDDRAIFEAAWAHGQRVKRYRVEHRIVVEGHIVWVEEQAEFECDEAGQLRRAIGTVQDITERKLAQLALEREREQLATALEAIHASTWEWDLDGDRLQVGPRWDRLMGRVSEGLRTLTRAEREAVIHPDDLPRLDDAIQRHLDGRLERVDVEYRARHEKGHWIWIRSLGRLLDGASARGLESAQKSGQDSGQQSGQPSARPGGEGTRILAGIDIDISTQKRIEQQLSFVANHDLLTGLLNRSTFDDILAVEMATCVVEDMRLAVVYIDLDDFSVLNESLGRDVADRLLVELSSRICTNTSNARHVARIGGDEFAVILSGIRSDADLTQQVERLASAFDTAVEIDGTHHTVKASLGVSLFPQYLTVDAEQLLRQADQAMYRAKLNGKQQVFYFDPERDSSTRHRMECLNEIRLGLDQDEFVLYYQPKVNMRTGALIGLEALIRWQHPKRGLLAPGVFIPVVEHDPLSIRLGDWVIREALRQLDLWRKAGLDTAVSVSVNIGTLQLHDPDFAMRVERHLGEYPDVKPSQLELEVLETGAIEDMDNASALLRHLHTLGMTSALDDFGTGYSSLTFLTELPAQVVKIDQSFVRGMVGNAKNAIIIESIMGLAQSLDRNVIAEGIEDVVHGELMLELGCELGQGYAIARPMPPDQALEWLRTWSPPPSWASVPVLSPERKRLLLAELDHRGWLEQLLLFLRGKRTTLPSMDPQCCRFGRWLSAPGICQALIGMSVFDQISAHHEMLHATAHQLVMEHNAGSCSDQLDARLASLTALSNALLDILKAARRAPDKLSMK